MSGDNTPTNPTQYIGYSNRCPKIKSSIYGMIFILHSNLMFTSYTGGKAYITQPNTIIVDLLKIMTDEIYLLYQRGCRNVQIDEPMLPSIADSVSVSQAIAMVNKITGCFEVNIR